LTVLLAYDASEYNFQSILSIAHTITGLCELCISHNGHLPMATPPWPSSRPSPLVQICHGTPGLLLLLAVAKGNPGLKGYEDSKWDEAMRLGSERVWEEGLLSKGGGLCHGITGNAWPWLLLHEKFKGEEDRKPTTLYEGEPTSTSQHERLSADYFLSKALAFLLAARETQPSSTDSPYRMPDNPFSLFEGLAGTICAWAEACAVVTARLKLLEEEKGLTPKKSHEEGNSARNRGDILGFPGLGGMGPHSLL